MTTPDAAAREAEKECQRCGIRKPRAAFHRHSRESDGLNRWCRTCKSAHMKALRAKPEVRAVEQSQHEDWYFFGGGKTKTRVNNRRWRRETKRPAFSDRNRARARWQAQAAVRRGLITRQPCQDCGNQKAQMHHEDYSKPLVVKWLCGPCHRLEHLAESERQAV